MPTTRWVHKYVLRGLVWGSLSLAGLAYEMFFRAREPVVILGYVFVLGISVYYILVLGRAGKR
ncbi:MAG: hypothetical protein ONB23_00360 [candidate division KSB1 bacterium]|nr:hypothetical protein [candidate division KSB1 bacterium]